MSLSDHVDIIRTVTNRHRDCLWVLFAYHLHDFSFLLGTHTACKHHICLIDELFEFLGNEFVAKDFDECFTTDDDSYLAFAKSQALIVMCNSYLVIDVDGAHTIYYVWGHTVIQQLAGVANVNCRLNFVTSEHPKFNSSLSDHFDGSRDSVLKLILERCRAYKFKAIF